MRVKVFVVVAVVVVAFSVRPASQNANAAAANSVAGEILVKFQPGVAAPTQADVHRQGGGTVRDQITRTGVQRVSVAAGDEAAAIARYRRNPNVLYAEPHFTRSIPEPISHSSGSESVPGDYYFDEQWGLHNTGQLFQCFPWPFGGEWCSYIGTPDADIDAPEAWAIPTSGAEVTVAVIDSGIDYTHPDFAGRYVGGFDFINNDEFPMDDHGHGTHVAGIIAAMMNNPTGDPPEEEGIAGVAPNARIRAYKVCRPDPPPGEDQCSDFAIQQAIAQAITDGAKVINMSLGDLVRSESLNDAVQDAWSAGLVIVAGAGNEGGKTTETDFFYPAAFENVISVAAFDEDHRRASFSSYGTWVDVSAPGNVIMSTYPMEACGGGSTVPGDTGCYNWLSGTSMATPHVSAAAALVWSRSDVTTNSQVVDILLHSADPRGVSSQRLDSWTKHGGLNLHDALSHGVTNEPPVANAGVDQTVIDDGDGVENVTLNGSASTDADGSIMTYEWREGTTLVGVTATPTLSLSVGTHTFTLTVTDNGGGTDTDSVNVTVQPLTDTVVVTKATYNSRRSQLTVEATSSGAPSATLMAYKNTDPPLLGPLSYNRKRGVYVGTFSVSPKPASVLVTSSGGGSNTSVVSGK